jgi:predicted RNA-binding Zn-ribbon protein involved in translation (DUF1610 family)
LRKVEPAGEASPVIAGVVIDDSAVVAMLLFTAISIFQAGDKSMAYQCPKCGGKASRVGGGGGGAFGGGLVGALLASAFSFKFKCDRCGDLSLNEMPPGTGGKVLAGSLTMIVIALAVLIGVICLLVSMNK